MTVNHPLSKEKQQFKSLDLQSNNAYNHRLFLVQLSYHLLHKPDRIAHF